MWENDVKVEINALNVYIHIYILLYVCVCSLLHINCFYHDENATYEIVIFRFATTFMVCNSHFTPYIYIYVLCVWHTLHVSYIYIIYVCCLFFLSNLAGYCVRSMVEKSIPSKWVLNNFDAMSIKYLCVVGFFENCGIVAIYNLYV